MGILDSSMTRAPELAMRRTTEMHMDKLGQTAVGVNPQERDFGSLLMSKLDGVNEAQTNVNTLRELMLTNPDAVDAHDITVAMAKAQMTMGLTKAVVDKAVQAYKDIVNMR